MVLSMERAISVVEENADSQNIMRVCKDHTTEDAVVVTEKAMKTIKLKTIHSCERKLFRCCT